MLKRFLKYYKPHMKLFVLDLTVAALSSILSIFIPILSRRALKLYVPEQLIQPLLMTLGLMVGIILVNMIFQYIRMYWGHILGVRMEYDMRSDIFTHIQKLSFTYFDNVKTGHIMSRISNDLNMIAEVAHHAPEDIIISGLTIIGAYTVMMTFNLKLGLIALVPLPLMLFWGLTYGLKMREGFRNVRKRIADINSNVENSVQGIREVKSYTNENLEIEKFNDVNTSFKVAKEKMYKIMATFFSGMFFLTDMFYVWVIGAGSWLIYKGEIDIADLLAFTLYVSFIMKPVQRVVNFVEQFQQGAASFERFVEIMDIEPDIKDKKNAVSIEDVKGSIDIDNIWFKYSSSPDWILKNVSMQIDAGKTIALVGESGAGKSTLVSLIPRFYELAKGSIKVDGTDILDLKHKILRESIGIVQQNVFLFDTTIRDNISYGNPYATEEQIIEASQKANIYKFIMSLPEGFDTQVGERGIKLSGGQKQRISIARVFLKNPAILIFDEATSSLDSESEAYIQSAMEELSINRTTIIIAHRLSTVKNADYIFVMEQGQVAEQGTHDELIKAENIYFNLYTKNMF